MTYKDPTKQAEYLRRWRAARPGYMAAHVKRQKKACRDWYLALKTACSRCGYDRCKGALQFHHPNKDKESEVSRMVRAGLAKARVLAEIAKRLLVCANCHAEEHYGAVM